MSSKNFVLLCSVLAGVCQVMHPAEALFGALGGAGKPGAKAKKDAFPIVDDKHLHSKGGSYSHEQFAVDCGQGNRDIIDHFLDSDNYEKHLNLVYDNNNTPLSLAAFGYLEGKRIRGIIPKIGGFKALARDKRVKKDFMIRAGHGQIAFDEYLLQDAEADLKAKHPDDSARQARLTELQKVLLGSLSKDRRTALNKILERKKKKKKQEAQEQSLQANGRNKKIAFAVGFLVVGGCYWLYKKRSSAVVKDAQLSVK